MANVSTRFSADGLSAGSMSEERRAAMARKGRRRYGHRVPGALAVACALTILGSTTALASVSEASLSDRSTSTAAAVSAQRDSLDDAVSAVLVDFNDGCNVDQAWATLNADWSQY